MQIWLVVVGLGLRITPLEDPLILVEAVVDLLQAVRESSLDVGEDC
jgi:hypothetical protein